MLPGDGDPRRYRIIACRRADRWFFLEIDDVRWVELEWINDRGWLIKDAAGRHVAEHLDAMGALRLARRMIVDGRMPTPEQAIMKLNEDRNPQHKGEEQHDQQ